MIRSGTRRQKGKLPSAPRRRTGRLLLRFLGISALILIAFYAVAETSFWNDRVIPRYMEIVAQTSALSLRVLGEAVAVDGSTIRAAGVSLSIRRGCDALEPSALLLAAIVAFPAPWRKRLVGLLVGFPLLQVANILRVDSLFYVQRQWPEWFETAHVDIWQPLFIALTLAFWAGWALWVVLGWRSNERGGSHNGASEAI